MASPAIVRSRINAHSLPAIHRPAETTKLPYDQRVTLAGCAAGICEARSVDVGTARLLRRDMIAPGRIEGAHLRRQIRIQI